MSEDRDVTAQPPRDDVAVLVPAAGMGTRLGAGRPKALRELDGVPLLVHALRRVVRAPSVAWVVVAAPPADVTAVRAMLGPETPERVTLTVVAGGATRQESVGNALAATPDTYPIVLVHDAARSLTPPELFERVAAAVRAGHRAVIPVLPVVDTVKRVDGNGTVLATVDRSTLRAVQTPQGFDRHALIAAHRAAGPADARTDDAGLVEALGLPVYTIPGAEAAMKITRPFDLDIARLLLRAEARVPA